MRPPLNYKQLCETCAAPQVVVLRTNHTRTNSHISQIIFRRLLDKPGNRGAKDSKYTAAISQDSRPSDAVGCDASLCVRICMRAYMHAGAPRHDLTIHVHAYTQRTCKIPKVATQGRFVHFCVLHAGSHMRLCAYMCFMAAFVCTYAGQLGCT